MERDAARVIYLDANATVPPAAEVVETVAAAMARLWGNASSRHPVGAAARRALEEARAAVAALLGVAADEVVFTSGATEANRLAIEGALRLGEARGRREVVASAIEHPSVGDLLRDLEAAGRCAVRWLPVDAEGRARAESLGPLLSERTALVTLQWANSETGVVQPVGAVAALVRAAGALMHTDAAQAVGRVTMDLADTPVDLLSVSGHKIHGPRGSGALVVRVGAAGRGSDSKEADALRAAFRAPGGGHHEAGRRPGTEDVPAAVGLGVAARLAADALAGGAWERVRRLRDGLEARLAAAGAVRSGAASPRLPNTLSVRFPGVDGAALVGELGRRGICASTGSACLSRSHEPSHVLLAMGIAPDEARGSLRLSLTRDADKGEVEAAAREVVALAERLRRLASA